MLILQVVSFVLLAPLTGAVSLKPKGLKWEKCKDIVSNSSLPYKCATHEVPLDWTAPQNNTIKLQLIKVPATKQPAKGSIQFNFGGPGLEGRNTLLAFAERLLLSTGGTYDLVAFDPRGTGNTIPFNCSKDPSDLYSLVLNAKPTDSDGSAEARDWAFGEAITSRCYYHDRDIGEMIGTAFGARDLMSVAEVLDKDRKLRYWGKIPSSWGDGGLLTNTAGFSYGTTLGATVSAMFPDRIDRVILDGTQNIHEYYHGFGEIEQWTDADRLFSTMLSTCIDAGAKRCPLAATYNDSSTLEKDIWNAMGELKKNPLAITTLETSLILDHLEFKGILANALDGIDSWPAVAAAVQLLLERNTDNKEFANLITKLLPFTTSDQAANALGAIRTMGIRGSDRFTRAKSRKDLSTTVAEQEKLSRMIGGTAAMLALATSRWKFHAKERYEGSWQNITTAHPLLVIGNTLDAKTSLKCAHNTSAIFDDSVVLEVQAYGHTSLAGVSNCSDSATAAYFVNGTLPSKGKACPVDIHPYEESPTKGS
ncbi:Peptidase S33 tripeptidyl aminopeptidase-lik [Fusarium austroafricanum]|uniref:Peptidase S33 tripeptidyl aminopeptidase-lik n=1 Tax=Fusarium austroafricanum TaxID=2364996 RepID=A0A8H4KWU2_9HYPO|nr:Peptidase S33 tripeptidyl aminopeptidase-lik [Fusarium austroafricanum]